MTWQQLAHNPEVAGSNPAPATQKGPAKWGLFCLSCFAANIAPYSSAIPGSAVGVDQEAVDRHTIGLRR
jgi:hypothetical protein